MHRFVASLRDLVVLGLLLCICQLGQAQNFVTTYAGDGVAGLLDGDTLTAQFDQPSDLDWDPFGNQIVLDWTHVVRKISPSGIVTTLAGTGVAGYLDGPGGAARFNGALSACVDSVGNVYVSDFQNQRIRKIDVNGNVTTIAGTGLQGNRDTIAMQATFRYPRGICMDRQGNLYIADSWNHRIRKLDPQGNVTTFAGGGTSVGVQSPGAHVDGPDTSARFWTPCGLEIDAVGNLYLADAYNHRIRKITPQGVVSTVAGSGPSGSTSGSYLDGAANIARFNTPVGLGVDGQGDVYVADTYNNCIRYVSGGNVTTAAGSIGFGYVNGNSDIALFDHPRSALVDASGDHVYIPDGNNHVIRKITLGLTIAVDGPLATQVMVFPNPAEDVVRIDFGADNSGVVGAVRIVDCTGKVVLIVEDYASGAALNVQGLAAGIYVACAMVEDELVRVRFVKE